MNINKDDKLLIKGIRQGDKAVFKHLYDVYYRRLFLFAQSYIQDVSISEDIVQDLFFNLWEKREELLITSSLSSYLFRAVHNRSIQYLRHKKVSEIYENDQQTKLKEAEIMYHASTDYIFTEVKLNEIEKIVRQTFETLPERSKEIFSLSRDHIATNKDIADKLKIDIKTVEYHITKVLKTLRDALKDYF